MSTPANITLFNYQVLIGKRNLSKSLLEPMIEKGFQRSPSETEMQKISATIDKENDRFIRLVFSTGSVYPLPPNVISIENGKTTKNRRKKTEIEPKFSYGIMDTKTGEVWLQYNKNSIFREALNYFHPNEHIEIKQILDEEQFQKSINEIKEIKLTILPNTLSCSNSLTEHLQEDIYQYGASSAEFTMKYKEKLTIEKVKNVVKNFITNKLEFKKLVIAGKNTDNLEMVFNTNIVSSKIGVTCSTDENGLPREDELFKQAILKILEISP
ncbi:hypothetical protein [Neisseria sp. Marseille-Q5346]|uniref:hypothetical protein n=1 Tax=Neisseria sp. Marseille-Q5346 TaxID=2972775 RepID=UPI0021E05060|nr:hypothetical protein [Neisseria sp. Marseille-Q5346]